jgi:hypothetical protein
MEFSNTDVDTIDFTTAYGSDALKKMLFANLSQCVLNEVVQKMLESRESTSKNTHLNISAPELPLGLYLDMFSDDATL